MRQAFIFAVALAVSSPAWAVDCDQYGQSVADTINAYRSGTSMDEQVRTLPDAPIYVEMVQAVYEGGELYSDKKGDRYTIDADGMGAMAAQGCKDGNL